MSKLLITGAGGFVGQALCGALRERQMAFVPVLRQRAPAWPQALLVANITAQTDWRAGLRGVDVALHLAARVHMLADPSPDQLRDYRLANVEATLNLARQCAAAGVRRLVFLSSVKVNGESSGAQPFRATDQAQPVDPYGVSKYEAEHGLREIARATGLEVVIIRPPLVYGPYVKANFLQLMRWIERGVPLPFARVVHNRRSMIFVGNLVDLMLRCASAPAAPGHTFLASDGYDVSTAELIFSIAQAMGRRALLLPVPPALLLAAASLAGKKALAVRLLGSLQVDISLTKSILDWQPPYSFEAGIALTVRHFIDSGNG